MIYKYQNTLKHSTEAVNEWVNELDETLGWEDKDKSFQVLRATLHALRDVLPISEVAQLSSQMPILIRGIFYEEWKPSKSASELHEAKAFVQHVHDIIPNDRIGDPERAVTAVFLLLNMRITAGEISDVRANLREGLRKLWPDPLK